MNPGFDSAVDLVLKYEGGYVNHPDDPGGETNMGISKRAYPKEDIKNMTVDRAKEIYKKDYWDKVGGDKFSPGVADVLMNIAVMSGPSRAQQMLSRVFQHPERLTDSLIEQANKDPDFTSSRLITEYRSYLRKLRAYQKFGKGWENRLDQLESTAVGGKFKNAKPSNAGNWWRDLSKYQSQRNPVSWE